MNYEARVFDAILAAQAGGLAVRPPEGVLSGYSGEKFLGLLQRLAGLGGAYLEIGVFQGLTLLTTAFANPKTPCYGIDNFGKYDPDGTNESTVRSRGKALALDNWHILNMDFEVALDRLEELVKEPVGLYLIDGPHDYRSQLVCLGFAADKIKPGGVVIVDDANYRHVRQATADFLKMRPDYKLIFEAYTPKHPYNMSAAEEAEARAGWWDGIHVLIRDTENRIEGLIPPTEKSMFINDHEIHAAAFAPLSFEAVNVLHAFSRPLRLPKAFFRLLRELVRPREKATYAVLNTYSKDLPTRMASIRGSTVTPKSATGS